MQGRIKHALMLCGPGMESESDEDDDTVDLNKPNISRGGNFGSLELPPGFGPRPQAMPIGKRSLSRLHFTIFN